MAVVLGRPGFTNTTTVLPTLPIDAPCPKDRLRTPVQERDPEVDPPTPLTRSIWSYKLMDPMRDIQELEKDGPCPKDYSKVERVHQKVLDLDDAIPAYLRLGNPDTRWDDDPECYWLPHMRIYLSQIGRFNIMALHRPYIFNRAESRLEALKACIEMLQRQRLSFEGLKPNSWKKSVDTSYRHHLPSISERSGYPY
jgi:hypothetical protein